MSRSMLHFRQRGVSLIELMITMAITMFLVAAAAYVYLGTRETQRAIERNSSNVEVGSFALELIGRDIMNAGFYPVVMPPLTPNFPNMRRYDAYPPAQGVPVRNTDWIPPATSGLVNPYANGIFGCQGSNFSSTTGTCGSDNDDNADSLVINYFTSDAMDANVGTRRDCNGADVGNDASNAIRKLNQGVPATAEVLTLPPQLPLFGSNRYALVDTKTEIDKQVVTTKSLACQGNGGTGGFQPLVAGIEDLQITYGVFSTEASRAPDRFYTAPQVTALGDVQIGPITMPAWSRVVAVRVCIMARSLGAAPKIADKSSALRTYTDCKGVDTQQLASDNTLRKRYVQVFAVRNRLNQAY